MQPVLPRYDDTGLAGVLPAALRSVTGEPPAPLTPAAHAVVVLVDGLGEQLLRRRGGHAPFLRSLLPQAHSLTAGYPTTTATSMGTFGTGLPPGAHGLVGYEVRVPDDGRRLNELSWDDGPDPLRWQPHETVLERGVRAGVDVAMIGPGYFDGSGLTRAALRGARFRAARTLADRVDAALAVVRSSPHSLTYLYWGDVDKTGHVHGCESWQWGEEVESTDAELRRLAESLPSDASLTITADHGMVDVPFADRVDLALEAELDDGVEMYAGEPRAVQLHCRPGASDDVAACWRARFADGAWVTTRDEALDAGWFGDLTESDLARTAGRIGDVLVTFHAPVAVEDSRVLRPEVMALLGLHGSLTADEALVPLLHLPARR